MDGLAYDLKRISLQTGEGSLMTRDQRFRGLQLIAGQLKKYKLPSAGSIKEKHIDYLVTRWQAEGKSVGTIKNRMSWVRWWARKARKGSVVPGNNMDLGIERRTAFKGDRAGATTGEQLAALAVKDERMALAVRLQMAFGLRLEESLKFRPADALRGDHPGVISLKNTWCKGKRAREVPITIERQRELLDEVRSVVGNGSLVPEGMDYIVYRKRFERETAKLRIDNVHKHRHWFAQWRYRTLTGMVAPGAGGPLYANMSGKERASAYRARMQISRELGHERHGITDVYLGGRFSGKGAAR